MVLGPHICGGICVFIFDVKCSSKCSESFSNMIILNRCTQVSDQDISVIGTGIKELRSLIDLSLNFSYKLFGVMYTKPFCEGHEAYWDNLFVVIFCFIILAWNVPKWSGILINKII